MATLTPYTREMGTICPFGVFPLFYGIFRFKIGHFSGPKRANGGGFGVPRPRNHLKCP